MCRKGLHVRLDYRPEMRCRIGCGDQTNRQQTDATPRSIHFTHSLPSLPLLPLLTHSLTHSHHYIAPHHSPYVILIPRTSYITSSLPNITPHHSLTSSLFPLLHFFCCQFTYSLHHSHTHTLTQSLAHSLSTPHCPVSYPKFLRVTLHDTSPTHSLTHSVVL